MTEATEKPIAQIAYEAFLEEIAKTQDADEARTAPPWEAVPDHIRAVIANAVGAAVRSFAPALIAEVTPEEQSYAQAGYQAYVARTGGLNYQGLPCPKFEALTETIKAAWAAAATRIRTEHEHRNADGEELAFSHGELAELIAGLDAVQSVGLHSEVCRPLRARLRAVLANPLLTVDLLPPPNPHDAPPESPSAEGEPVAPAAEPSPPVDADTGLVGAPELPSPSKAPPGPGVPDLDIPGPPALPTDTDPPKADEPPAPPPAPSDAS